METSDLKKTFAASAALSLAVFLVALPMNSLWAARYGTIAVLALINWFALWQLLVGITSKNLAGVVMGLAIKPLLLVFLLIVGKYMGIEISSFLVALNTFFVTLFLHVGFKLVRGKAMTPARVELEG